MQKFYIFIACIFFGVIFQQGAVFAVESPEDSEQNCEYISKLDQCIIANKNGQARSIRDFVCIESGDTSRILDQIILDIKFQEIDEKVETYLANLNADKMVVLKNPNQLIDDITFNLAREGYYYKQYKALCNGGLLVERLSCSEVIPNMIGANYLDGGNFDERSCINLVNTKMDIYFSIAKNILYLNKSTVQRDEIQVYRQEQLSIYQVLYDLMRDILGFLERLANGISHWTERPYGS